MSQVFCQGTGVAKAEMMCPSAIGPMPWELTWTNSHTSVLRPTQVHRSNSYLLSLQKYSTVPVPSLIASYRLVIRAPQLIGFALIDNRKTNFIRRRDTQDYSGLHRPPPASTSLHRPPQASTGLRGPPQSSTWPHTNPQETGEMLVLNQSYFRPCARNGPPVRLVIARAFHKRKIVRQNWSRLLIEKHSFFILPWPR